MPILSYNATEAYARTSENRLARYPHPKRDKQRLLPSPQVAHEAKFRFEREAPIYAIGSCFARNLERCLGERGFRVASVAPPESELARVENGRSFFNKYAPHAIEQELRWALDPTFDFPGERAFLSIGEDRLIDPHLGGSVVRPLPEMLKLRSAYNAHIAGIKDCPVVIVTLGLVECWYDRELNLYLNMAPPHAAVTELPERFEFHVLDYNEVLASLERSYQTLKTYGHPDGKLLITVSPVPLARTFRSDDVLQASCYSKSVLRAAVDAFRVNKSDVAYFPSYEMVTLADRDAAWSRDDYRHVNADMVARVMDSAMAPYVDEPVARAFTDGRMLYRMGKYEEALEVLEPLTRLPAAGYLLVWTCAVAHKKLGRLEESLEYMALAAALEPGIADINQQRIRLLTKLGRLDEAEHLARTSVPESVLETQEAARPGDERSHSST